MNNIDVNKKPTVDTNKPVHKKEKYRKNLLLMSSTNVKVILRMTVQDNIQNTGCVKMNSGHNRKKVMIYKRLIQ